MRGRSLRCGGTDRGRFLEQFLGMGDGPRGVGEPREHARELGHPRVMVEDFDPRRALILGDAHVSVGEAGDLRQVGHHHDLAIVRQLRQAKAHRQPGLTADPGVDLVEDQRGDVIEVGQIRMEGPAAELAASDEVRKAYLGAH